ncbi:DNA-binding response regulator [Cupriavidus pauculus]|jgi:DNA-binding NarL/FixJ family response regulator|uniref:DNA-binding response regulator n=1 Tax=Cupriavidus pauculus TaxID=82633 RepID=UPI001D0BFA11|nr:DNA-binding response regulator [Cupriavidus pauculus]
MTALVIDAQPLFRLGMQRLLERVPGCGAVRALDPAAIVALQPDSAPAIVLYGMSEDATDNWYLLRRLHLSLPNARILLLSDNMWLRVPESLQACGVTEHLPKSASIERMEAAILQMLGCQDFVPPPESNKERWRPASLLPRTVPVL